MGGGERRGGKRIARAQHKVMLFIRIFTKFVTQFIY